MKADPTTPDTVRETPDDEDAKRVADRAHGYFHLGMFDEAWEILESVTGSPALEVHLAGSRCLVAYARCDMEAVVAVGLPHCGNPVLHTLIDNLVATGLHHCDYWREAVCVLCASMSQHGRTHGAHYGLACYLAGGRQFEEALTNLESGIRHHPSNARKSLVDSDLQDFWEYLAEGHLAPPMREILQSDSFRELAHLELTPASIFTWDVMDQKNLLPEFGRWMRTNPKTLASEMLPAAPPEIRRRFAEWSLARARTSQRLLRRAIQRAR
jgi:hypothetical protein